MATNDEDVIIEDVEAELAGKPLARSQPPWLDPGDLVCLVDDGRRGVVLCVESGYFGTLYRVRVVDNETELELPREALRFQRRSGLLVFC